ncbi:SpaH/EbpB family LPXTG-anchored major pilin [Arcanobacterium hippocoleae]|uniref:Fimbrial isopeptide formation D2 family protein/LPXTG-motif cell wall-anchored protein n=1 Tax=Arcanobacterium hippocoleae TaxID=149017 RepID=A0ABU1T2V4_9ACTO|nr:SpaH/EbpB family LPXTG-anchored major pilin [Arcanobacterium hippocoleae]MDR6939696.1 fimbrial isopeptide formation D2 family protein/LPXTG-motif cell wall-anchored protein [Arcanobacterium hippocoleae]
MYALRMSKKGIALLAVMLMGLVLIGLTPFARAAEGNIDTNRQGSITIHKYENPGTGIPGDGKKQDNINGMIPLADVVFEYAKVNEVNLKEPSGWEEVKELQVSADGQITRRGVSRSYSTEQARRMEATDYNGKAKADQLDLGVYLVKEVSAPENVTTKSAPFLVTIPFPSKDAGWLYDIHVYPKNTVLTDSDKPVKTVANADAVHFPGDTIIWQISQPIPALGVDETLKSFKITDQLPKDVNPVAKSDIVVQVKDDQGFTKSGFDPKVEVTNQRKVTVTFENGDLAKLKSGWKVNVFISAVVSLGIDGSLENQSTTNINGVDFKSSSAPDSPGDENPTETVFGTLNITKINNDHQALGDARFQISPAKDGKCEAKPTSFRELTTSNQDGTASLRVAAGDYCVKETKAPLGYEIDPFYKSGIVVTVSDHTGTALEVINLRANDGEGGMLPNLPLTGAAGVVILTVLGGMILAAGAGFVIIAMRRRNHQGQ